MRNSRGEEAVKEQLFFTPVGETRLIECHDHSRDKGFDGADSLTVGVYRFHDAESRGLGEKLT